MSFASEAALTVFADALYISAFVQFTVEVAFFDLNVPDRIPRLVRFLPHFFALTPVVFSGPGHRFREAFVAASFGVPRSSQVLERRVSAESRVSGLVPSFQVTISQQNVHFVFFCCIHRVFFFETLGQFRHELLGKYFWDLDQRPHFCLVGHDSNFRGF